MSKFLKALRGAGDVAEIIVASSGDDGLILNSLVRSLGVTKIVVDSLLIFLLSVNLSFTL